MQPMIWHGIDRFALAVRTGMLHVVSGQHTWLPCWSILRLFGAGGETCGGSRSEEEDGR